MPPHDRYIESGFSQICISGLLKWCALLALSLYPIAAGWTAVGPRDAIQKRAVKSFPSGELILPDVLVVRRSASALGKTDQAAWENMLQRIDAIGSEPMFQHHVQRSTSLSGIVRIQLQPGSDVLKACAVLSRNPQIAWAEPIRARTIDHEPDDPYLSLQWSLDKIRARDAWDISRGDTAIIIAVIDTGVDLDHPDLAAHIWTNPGEIPGDGEDNDHNGYIDDIHGYDFGGDDFGQPDNDPDETVPIHGTTVAGVAGAVTNNGLGIASPAYAVRIMPVKASVDTDPGHIWYGYEGMFYAAENGADFISCSFGGGGASNLEQDVIDYVTDLGALVVASAGNGDTDGANYPASYPGVLSVTATDQADIKAFFSNYGYSVDLSAPGLSIYTSWSGGSYRYMSGTSYSAPLAASAAALVKAVHSTWTGQQAGEQVRVTADPIDALNPAYAEKLGRGRLNLYRALTETSPSIRLTDVQFEEGSSTNHDGIFDPGEEILLSFHVINYLEPATGVVLTFHTDHPDVVLGNATFQISGLGMLGEWTNTNSPVRIQIDPAVDRGQRVDIRLDISAGETYQDVDHLDFIISPVYATIRGENAHLTLTSTGRLGYADYPHNMMGESFAYGDADSLLFEGAVMAGTGPDILSDVARSADQNVQDQDFDTAPGGELVLTVPGTLADEQGFAVFSDETAPASMGLYVTQTSLAFNGPDHGGFVLLTYRLSLTFRHLENIHFGLFADWDVGYQMGASAQFNRPGYDSTLSLGYVYQPDDNLYCGLAVVSAGGASHYASIKNPDWIYDGYTDFEKWSDLSGGIRLPSDTTYSDYSHVLGVGPLDIGPGDTVLVGFAVLGGDGLDDLKANAVAAKAKWEALFGTTSVTMPESADIPSAFQLRPNHPNPFNASTILDYDVPKREWVTVTIHDLLGREVAHLADRDHVPGRYTVQWNGQIQDRPATSGVYFVHMQAGRFNTVRKMILMR